MDKCYSAVHKFSSGSLNGCIKFEFNTKKSVYWSTLLSVFNNMIGFKVINFTISNTKINTWIYCILKKSIKYCVRKQVR